MEFTGGSHPDPRSLGQTQTGPIGAERFTRQADLAAELAEPAAAPRTGPTHRPEAEAEGVGEGGREEVGDIKG